MQVQRATEDWIKDLCRAHWRRVGDKLIHVKTGVLERTEPEEKSIRYDATGRHWSFKPPPKRDRGRTYSRAEREAFLEERARRREEMDQEHPVQVLIRCDRPSLLASEIFQNSEVVEARIHDDRKGLFVKIRNQDQFFLSLNRVVSQGEIEVESIVPVDDDLSAVYEYLIGAQ